jgi:Icc-related predicted phosphoesterase
MRIQFFSDIHLEFGGIDLPETDADIIVAAGDIGVGLQGLQWLKKAAKPVVYVAGNHEFYGQDHPDNLKALQEGAAKSNVQFLDRHAVVMSGVRFLGCTLWTELGGEENDRVAELIHSVNDFRRIKYYGESLSFRDYSLLHRDARRWLIKELEKPFDGPTVVVTHHAPTHWSWRENPTNIRRYAYCNDLKELFHQFEIAAWIHGHTHEVSDYRCAGAAIVCNPRGYHPDHLVSGFDIRRVIEI